MDRTINEYYNLNKIPNRDENYTLSDDADNYMIGDGNYIGMACDAFNILPAMDNTIAKLVILPLTFTNWLKDDERFMVASDKVMFKAIDFIYAAGLAPEEICKENDLKKRLDMAKAMSKTNKCCGALRACVNPDAGGSGTSIKNFMNRLINGTKNEHGTEVGGLKHLASRKNPETGASFAIFKNVSHKHGIVSLTYSDEFLGYISNLKSNSGTTQYGTIRAEDFRKLQCCRSCMWYLLACLYKDKHKVKTIRMYTGSIKNFLGLSKSAYCKTVKIQNEDGSIEEAEVLGRTEFERKTMINCFKEINRVCKDIEFKETEEGLFLVKTYQEEKFQVMRKNGKEPLTFNKVDAYIIQWTKKPADYKKGKLLATAKCLDKLAEYNKSLMFE